MRLKGLAGPAVKSLIFVLITLMVTVVLGLSIAQTQVGATSSYNARFEDVSGLTTGDSVRVAGVQVGRVESIKVVDRHLAQVNFTVQKGRQLPASVIVSVKYFNLVGQRYLELEQGTGAVGTLAPGTTIQPDHTRSSLNLTQLFNGFQPLLQALAPNDVNQLSYELVQVLQGEGPTIANLVNTLGSLTTTLASKDKVFGQVIDNLNGVLDTVNSRSGEMKDLISTLQQLVSGLSADRQPIGSAIKAMDDLTNSTASLFQQGRPAIKEDINQIGRLSNGLYQQKNTIQTFLDTLPTKLSQLTRVTSYGSWLNLYLCQVDLSGVTYKQFPPEPKYPPPTGIPNSSERCR